MEGSTRQALWDLAEPIVQAAGCELIELEYLREQRWVVRLFIGRPNPEIIQGVGVAPGNGVGLEDCARVSRELSAVLDVEDVLSHAFSLEVSSPGAHRPLRRPSDFSKFLGFKVRVKTSKQITASLPEGEYPSRNMFGLLEEVLDESIRVNVDKRQYYIPFSLITRAYIEPDMKLWMSLAKKMQEDKGE